MIDPGLCATCKYARRVVSGRGSQFLMCGRAKIDPRFSRYPALPVAFCPGHEVASPDPEDPPS